MDIRTLVLCSSLLPLLQPASALELNQTLTAEEVASPPSSVRFLIYDSQDTSTPIRIADFGAGEFRQESLGESIHLSANLDEPFAQTDLWLETEIDGQRVGERQAIRAATPGVTFALGNNLNMSGNAITNLATPSAATDAASKGYVDSASITGNAATATALAANGSNCPAGHYAQGVDASGNAESCTVDVDTNSGGTVTSVTAGAGLTGGTINSSGTIAIDPSSATLTGNFHKQGGNAFGTDAVLGSTDNQAVEIRANNSRVMRFQHDPTSPNLIGGHPNNSVGAFYGQTVVGGGFAGSNCYESSTGNFDRSCANQANAYLATVLGGSSNQANGNYSTAMGSSTTANSIYSTAMGYGSTASGNSSTAMGYLTTASGNSSTAMGYLTTASGNYSTAMGSSTTANSIYSTAMGYLTTASDYYSTAMGSSTTASGYSSTAMGGFTTASGDHSAAMGNSTTASGYSSTAMGIGTIASGWYSTAMGYSTTASGNYSTAMGFGAKTQTPDGTVHQGTFVWADSTDADFYTTAANEFSARATGGVRFVTAVDGLGTPTMTAYLGAGSGSWNSVSDRNAKQDFVAVDSESVLQKVVAMPISQWRYKAEVSGAQHIGPMAQDFHAAFGLGDSDKTITTIDADGVALAAIQGLNAKIEEQQAEIEKQQAKAEEQQAKAEEQQAEIKALRKKLDSYESLAAEVAALKAQIQPDPLRMAAFQP